MKRYRDCTLVCKENQTVEQLMEIVQHASESKGYRTTRDTSIVNNDTLTIYINPKNLPSSRVVISYCSDSQGVSVVNIVPMTESGVSHINPETYNKLLDVFCADIFETLSKAQGNKIETNKEEYTIEELIPQSFAKLHTWLSNYPLSSHRFDINRWYDFVISLHENDEHLPLEDLRDYLKEKYGWSDDDIYKTEIRLETHLDLLKYYDDTRSGK